MKFNRKFIEGEETEFAKLDKWKGDIENKVYTRIITECCLCGMKFEKDKVYLVYAYLADDPTYFKVSTCSRSGLFSNKAHDIEVLKKKIER